MSGEWKPGDVAIVTDDHGTERVAVHGSTNPRMKHRWHYDESGIGRILNPLRRLVVIDPEDREQVAALVELLIDNGWRCTTAHGLRDALREFAKPKPAIEVPLGLGAVVEDAKGTKFVRVAEAFDGWAAGHDWQRIGGEINSVRNFGWTQIDAVRVLSEGVTA